MSEPYSQTPNAPKRRIEDKEEAYTEGKNQILDKARPEIRIARITPIERRKDPPNQKS